MKDHQSHFIVRLGIVIWLVKGAFPLSRSDSRCFVPFRNGMNSQPSNAVRFSSLSNAEFCQYYGGTSQFSKKMSLEDAILNRYACKKFRRYNHTTSTNATEGDVHSTTGSSPDPSVVRSALNCLNLARRTPTAFNTQPYKVVLVYTPEQKEKLSKFCLGPNKARVLDSDCTAIFLADKQIFWTLPRFRQLLRSIGEMKSRKPLTRIALFKMQFYIALFSSGYPLPRCLAAPISFFVRTGVALVNLLTKWFYPMPTLANAETWSAKQVTMVAMTYMLACSSQGLATIPMEGINAAGIRKVIRAPSRYAIPFIVSTGKPFSEIAATNSSLLNQEGLGKMYDRYTADELFFGDSLGAPLPSFDEPRNAPE